MGQFFLQLKEEFEIQRLEEELLGIAVRKDIRKELESLQKTPFLKDEKIEPSNFQKAVAIFFLILAFIFAFWFTNRKTQVHIVAKLELKETSMLGLFDATRRGELSVDSFQIPPILINLIRSNKNENLNTALNEISSLNQNNAQIQYLTGVIYSKTNQFDTAFQYFQKAMDNPGSTQKLSAWSQYYYLVHLMLEKTPRVEFQQIIEEIKMDESGHPFYPRMEDIEKRLN